MPTALDAILSCSPSHGTYNISAMFLPPFVLFGSLVSEVRQMIEERYNTSAIAVDMSMNGKRNITLKTQKKEHMKQQHENET